MIRSLISTCLSRRPLVLIAFAAFLAIGFGAFTRHEHRGLSRSGAADHRDHRAISRPVARGGRALRHDPDRDRGRQHARAEIHPLQLGVCAGLRPPAVRIRPRLLLRAAAGAQPAEGCRAAARRAAGHLAGRHDQRNLPLPARRPAEHGPHRAADAAGLGGGAPAAPRAGRGRRAGARRQDQGIPGRDRSRPHARVQPDAAADHRGDQRQQLQRRRPHHLARRAIGQRARARRRDLGQGHGQHRADAAGRPAGAAVRHCQEPGRLPPAARHGRTRRRHRRRQRHRADAEVRAHHGGGDARARGGGEAQHRRHAAARACRSCRSTTAAISSASP